MASNSMDFDIVIATRNRQAVLPLSLRTMLSQSRLPRRLIVVDASERHYAVRDIVLTIAGGLAPSLGIQVVHSEPGSARQRNVGTAYVRSPVVFYPDDDVLWFPGVAEAIMRIYEKDAEGGIGCVTAVDSRVPPPGTLEGTSRPYKLSLRHRLKTSVLQSAIAPLEARFVPDPVNTGGGWKATWGARVPPTWLRDEEGELCGPVLGFRMTFRTEVIRGAGGFDELMGAMCHYALFEDKDASLGSLSRKLNVVAKHARVFHYKEPSARASGWEFGAMSILNRAYVVSKHSSEGSVARKHLRRYLYYQIFRYLLQTHTRYGRERFRGALSALAHTGQLTKASKAALSGSFAQIQRSLAGSRRAGG